VNRNVLSSRLHLRVTTTSVLQKARFVFYRSCRHFLRSLDRIGYHDSIAAVNV
jgi:hypothetical protein